MTKKIALMLIVFTFMFSSTVMADTETSIDNELLDIQTDNLDSSELSGNGVIDFLPLLWKEVKARGATPPKPFFVSPVFYYMENYYSVSNATATIPEAGNLTIGGSNCGRADCGTIQIGKQTSKLLSYGFRAGVNILPFFNIYGVYVHTDGRSITKTYLRDEELYKLGFSGMNTAPYVVDMDNSFTAETGAIGTTLSYGIPELVGKWGIMTMINFNCGFTKASIIKDMKTTIVAAIRAGVMRDLPKDMRLTMWLGVDYLKMLGDSEWTEGKQRFTIPNGDPNVKDALWGDTYTADYRAKAVPNSPFGMTAGFGFSLGRHIDIAAEIGFLSKFSAMGAVSFNF